MTLIPAPGRARLRASAWDFLLIAGWLVLLAVMAAVIFPRVGAGSISFSVFATDAIVFGCSVLPVWLYLTASEASRAQASWGKRRAGLRVVTGDGGRPGWIRVAARNAVKLAPWELAHIAVVRLALEVDTPIVIGVTYGLSVLIVVVSITLAVLDPLRRALHDRFAGTRVVEAV